jgi:division/cell wall cluster transcriptional repressor MraZ
VADELAKPSLVEAPRGMYPAKLDDKGRMKFPAVFQEYFTNLAEKKLFVTSLDRHIATIYPLDVWRQNEKIFDDFTSDPEVAETVAFNAADLGSETEMDSQGRIVFSPELRRELGIENQPVHIWAYKGHIEILSEEIYNERRQQASQNPRDAVKKLQGAGLR